MYRLYLHAACISDRGQQDWRTSVTVDGYLGYAGILIRCIKRWMENERHWRQDSRISSHCHGNDVHIFHIQHTQSQHCVVKRECNFSASSDQNKEQQLQIRFEKVSH